MIIDTGASVSMFPMSMASLFGINQSELVATTTTMVAGKHKSFALSGKQIYGKIDAGPAMEFVLPEVHFVENAPVLLGCDALFGPFELRINRADIQIRLKPGDEPAD